MKSFFKRISKKIFSWLSHDMGIDLGTTNTLVYIKGKGVVLNEPSVVAINKKTGQIVDIGHGAKQMLGRTPTHIVAVKPLVDGVISDFEVAEEMLAYFINRAQEKVSKKFLGPRIVIGVPSGITNVERRAVRDAARNAGARKVFIVEEPTAAAMGIRLPIHDPVGSMIIDIGGGTADIAIMSLSGIVRSKNLKIAGEAFNRDIVSYIRDEFKILIGEKTADEIKTRIGSVFEEKETREVVVKGRDLVSGLPREVVITDSDVREALRPSIESLVEAIKDLLEVTPPEILSDIMQRGIFLVGGGALLHGLDRHLNDTLGISVYISEDPLTAVARGTGVLLEQLEELEGVLIHGDDELPIQN